MPSDYAARKPMVILKNFVPSNEKTGNLMVIAIDFRTIQKKICQFDGKYVRMQQAKSNGKFIPAQAKTNTNNKRKQEKTRENKRKHKQEKERSNF